MRANLKSLDKYAEKYLTEYEYSQFRKYLEERNSPYISTRMHANMEVSRMANLIKRNARSSSNRKTRSTAK
jgi:hypothetical protein